MKLLLIIILLLMYSPSMGQKSKNRLLAIEMGELNNMHNYFLTSYHFENGKFIYKDTILNSLDEFPKRSLLMNINHEKMKIKGNYLITSKAIIDIKQKKFIWQVPNKALNTYLHSIIDDRVIYQVITHDQFLNSRRNVEYYCFDLSKQKYEKLSNTQVKYSNEFESKSDRYRVSPNGNNAIYSFMHYTPPNTYHALYYDIHLFDLTHNKQHEFDLNNPTRKTLVLKTPPPRMPNVELTRLSTMWLDNQTFIFDTYLYDGDSFQKYRANPVIYTYNIKTYKREKICIIDSVRIYAPWYFKLDYRNQVFYRDASGNEHYIDVKNKKNTTSQPFYLTNDISYLYEKNPRRYKTYFYKGKNIIKIESRYEVYSSKALAIVSDEVKYKFKEPTDVKIWTKDKKELVLTITIPWLDKLIGWI